MTTRSDIETLLIARVGPWLTNVALDGSTNDGTNESLNDAIGWAIRQAGGTVAAPALVTSTDVGTVDSADLDKLLDLAELRSLRSILSSFTGVDLKAGPVEIKDSGFIGYVNARLAELRSDIATNYGIGDYGAFAIGLTRIDGYSDL